GLCRSPSTARPASRRARTIPERDRPHIERAATLGGSTRRRPPTGSRWTPRGRRSTRRLSVPDTSPGQAPLLRGAPACPAWERSREPRCASATLLRPAHRTAHRTGRRGYRRRRTRPALGSRANPFDSPRGGSQRPTCRCASQCPQVRRERRAIIVRELTRLAHAIRVRLEELFERRGAAVM